MFDRTLMGFYFIYLFIYFFFLEKKWYLKRAFKDDYKTTFQTVVEDFFSFVVLYNYVIPISLYVTMELQKFLGTLFFEWDLDMYDDKTQQAALCNTSDLNEDLGQIEYLFTGKKKSIFYLKKKKKLII